MIGKKYWKSMSGMFIIYFTHPESKFDGSIGNIERKYIEAGRITHIGKESDKIEEMIFIEADEDSIQGYNNVREQNKNDPYFVTKREAEKIGICKSTLKSWEKNVIDY